MKAFEYDALRSVGACSEECVANKGVSMITSIYSATRYEYHLHATTPLSQIHAPQS